MRVVVDLPEREGQSLEASMATLECNKTTAVRKGIALLELVLKARADDKPVIIGDERILVL